MVGPHPHTAHRHLSLHLIRTFCSSVRRAAFHGFPGGILSPSVHLGSMFDPKLGFESLVASHVVHTYIQYMYIYTYTYVYIYHIPKHRCSYLYNHQKWYVYTVYVHIYIYVYIYIYIYIISPNIDAAICTTIKSEKLVWRDPVVIWVAGRHQSQM